MPCTLLKRKNYVLVLNRFFLLLNDFIHLIKNQLLFREHENKRLLL